MNLSHFPTSEWLFLSSISGLSDYFYAKFPLPPKKMHKNSGVGKICWCDGKRHLVTCHADTEGE
jgi:hypothetical protein